MQILDSLTAKGVPRQQAWRIIQELDSPDITAPSTTVHNYRLAVLQMWGQLSQLQAEVFLAEHGYDIGGRHE